MAGYWGGGEIPGALGSSASLSEADIHLILPPTQDSTRAVLTRWWSDCWLGSQPRLLSSNPPGEISNATFCDVPAFQLKGSGEVMPVMGRSEMFHGLGKFSAEVGQGWWY